MSKRKWLITGVLIVFLLLLGVIAYWFFWPEEYYEEVHNLKQTFSGNPVKEMKIGESYEVEDMVFQMVDETHFVYTIDYSGYANQKELEDTRWIMESEDIYPEIFVAEGEYYRKGEDIFIKETRGMQIVFETVADVKEKKYAVANEVSYAATGYNPEPQFTKKGKHYVFDRYLLQMKSSDSFEKRGKLDRYPVYSSQEKLPESIQQLLTSYKQK